MTPDQIDALYQRLKPSARAESKPQYTKWQLKTSELTITAYNSGKVVFQGKDVSWLEHERPSSANDKTDQKGAAAHEDLPVHKDILSQKGVPAYQSESGLHSVSRCDTFPMAGSDETGTGDYFGPVCTAAVIVPDLQTANRLKAMGITDSKAMNDAYILKIEPEIKAMLPHAIHHLSNEKHNQVWNKDTMNLNRIKALMHNRCYLDLQTETGSLPDNRIVDQFCVPSSYYKHLAACKKSDQIVRDLYFETKAESRYIAVAAASVLARAEFLHQMEAMDKEWNFHFEKGASSKVDACGRKFLQTVPNADLSKVAKLHFANTAKIKKGICSH